MGNEKFNKGIEDLRKVGMTASEKSLLLNRILSRFPKENNQYWKNQFSWSLFLRSTSVYYTSFAVLVIFVSGGALFASQSALPGDLLYSVKVNVAEPLRGIAITDQVQKVTWESQKLESRLEEVEILAAKGTLSPKLREEAESSINTQMEKFNKAVAKVKKSDKEADLAQEDLNSKLDVHDKILTVIENHAGDNQKEEISRFRNNRNRSGNGGNVSTTMMATSATFSGEAPAAKMVESVSDTSVSTSTFEEKEKKLEAWIKSQEKTISDKNNNKKTTKLESDIISSTKDEISEAKESLKEARKNRNIGKWKEASDNLINSKRKIENVEIYIKQGSRIGRDNSN